jgi:uncharacterized phage protein (predicted DNA packaging)
MLIPITELGVQDVKFYLRIEHNEDDALIGQMVPAARAFIQSYLNKTFAEFEAEGGIPEEFIIPFYAIIGHWYDNRSIAADAKAYEVLYSFKFILDMHRRWQGGAEII